MGEVANKSRMDIKDEEKFNNNITKKDENERGVKMKEDDENMNPENYNGKTDESARKRKKLWRGTNTTVEKTNERHPLVDVTNKSEPIIIATLTYEDLAKIPIDDVLPGEKEFEENLKDKGWQNCDINDYKDIYMIGEYAEHVFRYLRRIEKKYVIPNDYQDKYDERIWRIRVVVIDWLVDTHWHFKFRSETLFMAINIFDQFLYLREIPVGRYILLAATALFIASKVEESHQVSIDGIIRATAGGCGKYDIAVAEIQVLKNVDFNVLYPTPYMFLRRISKAESYDPQTRTIAKYLIEISTYEKELIVVIPSKLAAAAVFLSRKMLKKAEIWNETLVHYSGYTENDLIDTTDRILDCLKKDYVISGSICSKYSLGAFLRVSIYADKYVRKLEANI